MILAIVVLVLLVILCSLLEGEWEDAITFVIGVSFLALFFVVFLL